MSVPLGFFGREQTLRGLLEKELCASTPIPLELQPSAEYGIKTEEMAEGQENGGGGGGGGDNEDAEVEMGIPIVSVIVEGGPGSVDTGN